ncbi:MAG TPA: LptF/LptG family permease, partial [Pirellulaceae bacterium]|nr:LptF/LptG family permease [Pirellulaceae bacterium]
SGDSPSNMELRNIPRELVRHRAELTELRRRLATKMATQTATGDIVGLTHPKWSAEFDRLKTEVYREHRLRSEPWRRWANGFSCLCFMLIGAPLAILMRRFDFWTNFAICFMPILLLYYPLMMLGVSQTKSGALPPWMVWTGNVALACVGYWLLRRVHKN